MKDGFAFVVSSPQLWLWFDFNVFCFVGQEFDDHRDADDAVYELNGKELLGERYFLNNQFD